MTAALLILLLAIQAADVWTTAVGLKLGASEVNPLARWLIARIGFWPMCLGLKGLMIALAVAAAIYSPSNAWIVSGGLSIIGAGVLASNVREVRKQRKIGSTG